MLARARTRRRHRLRFRPPQRRSRGVAVRRHVLRRSGALVRQPAQGP
jgi:hypothetical protein